MNKIEKLLRKISQKEREVLLRSIEDLLSQKNTQHLKPIKLEGLDLYRIRKGNFRIIFHKEHGEIIIDSIKMRNESTYK
jgi:mRNA-degrading endonuclease RelE of RelBE toxin-antitoxin system